MKLELYYHPFSPFTQKVWIWAIEKGIASQIQLHRVVVCPVPFPGWSDNNEEVGAWNPIAKVPTLVVDLEDENEKFSVHDSKIICDFIESISASASDTKSSDAGNKADAMRWKRESLHRAADGMMDCEIGVVYEERIRKLEGLYQQKWVDGMRTKIGRGFDFLEKAVKDGTLRFRDGDGDAVGMEECAAVAALAWFDKRGIEWRGERDGLSKWFDGWKERRSFKESRIDVDWKTGRKETGKI